MVNNVAIVILAQRDNDDVSLLVMPCYFKPLSNPWSELANHNNHKPLTPGFPRYLKKICFSGTNSKTPVVFQVLVTQEAIRARLAGIHILSVGTLNADQNQLRSISSVPQVLDTNYFYYGTNEQLRNGRQAVSDQLCLHSTLGDLYCKHTIFGYQCFCREEACYYRTMNGTQCTGR